MKKVTLKNYIVTLAQLPVMLLLFVVVCIEWGLVWGLVWCMVRLSNPMSLPFAKLSQATKPEDLSIYYRERGIEFILGLLGGQNDYTLNKVRIELEDTKTGRHTVSTYPDRHLYAVLKPDRIENLARIQIVLREMDNEAFERVHSNAWAMAKRS